MGKEVKGEDRGFQETSAQACFESRMIMVMVMVITNSHGHRHGHCHSHGHGRVRRSREKIEAFKKHRGKHVLNQE